MKSLVRKNKNVRVEIEVTHNEMKEITSKWITVPYGIVEGKRKGLIFVGGLYVCTIKGLSHAYNFKPSDIVLNRDRDIPSMWNIQHATLQYLSDDEKLEMAITGKKDVTDCYSSAGGLARSWSVKYAGYMPIGISEQGKVTIPEGMIAKIVPDWVARAIRGAKKLVINRIGSPLKRLEEWEKDYKWHVPSHAQAELSGIIMRLKQRAL